MISEKMRLTLVLVGLAGVAACIPKEEAPAQLAVYDFEPLHLWAGGSDGTDGPGRRPVREFNDAAEFRNVLRALDPELCGADEPLGRCLPAIRMRSNKLAGIAGVTSEQFVRIAQSAISTGPFRKPTFAVSGKINEYCLNNEKLPGYQYDAARRRLHICDVVKTEIENPGGQDPRVLYQFFDVVAEGNVAVDDRSGGTADNAFPAFATATGMMIPASLPDSFNPPLTHKLYAWGNDIRVMEYWETRREVNGEPDWNHPSVKKYTPSSPGMPRYVQEFFKTSPESCIDMMFLGPPPASLSGYTGGLNYCLGRCSKPPIINTR